MISNSSLPLDDVLFYTDERLSVNNVLNVTFAVIDYDELYPDIYTLMKSYCKLCLLQQISCYHCKFTFVTSLSPVEFFKQLYNAVSKLYYIRKLKPNQLVLL